MQRLSRWLDRGRAAVDPASLDPVTEAKSMGEALVAADFIMNDDIAGAEAHLAKGDSTFHKLARGTIGFLKATLGFEQEAMREASELLSDAENSAYLYHQKAINDLNVASSKIYGRGSEFALCQAEAQIMNAVVGILNESLTESIKGFYKVRKAYMTLNQLAQKENDFVSQRGIETLQDSNQSKDSGFSHVSQEFSSPRTDAQLHPPLQMGGHARVDMDDDSDEDDDQFYEAEDNADKLSEQHGAQNGKQSATDQNAASSVASGATTPALPSGATTPAEGGALVSQLGLLNASANSDVFSDSLDVFIHSGVNLMSGLINLLLSVIPPAFGRLLAIIGFRGEREKGLRMLWQASKFANLNGGLAALILFGWYNGIVGYCDIIPDPDPDVPDNVNGFPIERLHALLAIMRERYPGSLFWKLEEARTYSTRRQIDKALEILEKPHETQMRQLQAFHVWEKSLDYMNSHQYERCAENFLRCSELNAWSQALYYYAAACAYLQLYRDSRKAKDEEATIKYKALAEEYFSLAPTKVGKKKMMGRQLPLDTFVTRKTAKWAERATRFECDLIDAVGVAPLDELSSMWNGFKKMNEAQLNKTLENLAWLQQHSPYWDQEDENEKALVDLLRATTLRNLRKHDEAQALLQEKLLTYDSSTFRGGNQDDAVGPLANYEMATNYWMRRKEFIRRYGATFSGKDVASDGSAQVVEPDLEHDAEMVANARVYIEKAKGWGNYEMNVRIGMKVTAGFNAIVKWEERHRDLTQ